MKIGERVVILYSPSSRTRGRKGTLVSTTRSGKTGVVHVDGTKMRTGAAIKNLKAI